jgi:hypothetical protein
MANKQHVSGEREMKEISLLSPEIRERPFPHPGYYHHGVIIGGQ